MVASKQAVTWGMSAKRGALDLLPWETVAAVAFLVYAWLAATAWMRPLTLPDEGRYVGVAWEMVRSGNWLIPTLDTLPFFHKPPLFYWLAAGAISTLGHNEWSARLPSLLAATGAAAWLVVVPWRWAGRAPAPATLAVPPPPPGFLARAPIAPLPMLAAASL